MISQESTTKDVKLVGLDTPIDFALSPRLSDLCSIIVLSILAITKKVR